MATALVVISSHRQAMRGGSSSLRRLRSGATNNSSSGGGALRRRFPISSSSSQPFPSTTTNVTTRRSFFSRGGGGNQQQQQQQSHHRQYHHQNKRGSGASNKSFFSSFPFQNNDYRDAGLRWTSTVSNPDEVEGPVGIPSRAQQLRRLQGENNDGSENEHDNIYDVLVVGGGATGAGIALDAASRSTRMKVACVERGDFASETSSRSTKLIWAGLKYMGTAGAALLRPSKLLTAPGQTLSEFVQEMKMVYHCHVERHYMTSMNVHLTYWVPIVVPFYSWYCSPPPMGHALYSYFPILAPPTFQFYDALSFFTCPHSYILANSERIQKVFPQLKREGLKYCAVFYEAMHNDARTNLAIAMSAAQYGAHIANYVEVIQVLYDDNDNEETDDNNDNVDDENEDDEEEEGNTSNKKKKSKRATGVVAVDRMTNQVFTIRAKKVIFAGGPFTDQLRVLEEYNGPRMSSSSASETRQPNRMRPTLRRSPTKPAVRGAAGTHVVVPQNVIPSNMGLLNFNTSDGRFLFILPWLGHTLIGTTDKQGTSAETLHNPPRDEVDWILNEASLYLEKPLQRSDVLSAWRGWRPLATDPHPNVNSNGDGGDQAVSRDHVISENPQTGVIFIAGGKWTTWRAMAEDVVNRLTDAPCQTLKIPLHGGLENKGSSSSNTTKQVVQQLEALPLQVVKRYGQLDLDIAKHLVSTYGGRVWEVCALLDETNDDSKGSRIGSNRIKSRRHRSSELGQRLVQGFPYIQAEVVYACREYACTVEDVLSRRTRLSFLNKQASLDALPLVAQIMARELGWTKAVTLAQTQAARQYIDSYGGRLVGATIVPTTVTDNNNKDIHMVSFTNNDDPRNKGWLHRIRVAATRGLKMKHHGQQQHHVEEEDSDEEQRAA